MMARIETLGQALADLDARLFVGREGERGAFSAWLGAGDTTPGLIHVWGPGGSGKSALLRAFARMATAAGREVVFVEGRDIRPDAGELASALGGSTIEAAVEQINARRAVVLIDTFELLVDLTRVLQRDVLPRLGTGVRLVIAGRHPLGLAWGPWRQLVREFSLGGLSAAEVRQYLVRRGIHGTRVLDQAVAAAGGLPLAQSLIADLVLQRRVHDLAKAPEWHRLVRSLVEQLLEDVRDPVLRDLLEAGAVVRQFDEATLVELTDRDDIGSAFAQLCQLSIVRPGGHGLMLHDDVRHILAQDLRWRQPQRYTTLRLRALEVYRQRMRDAGPSEREWLVGERLALWENAFIQRMLFTDTEVGRVWLDWGQSEDVPELLRLWREWIDTWLAQQMSLHFDSDLDTEGMTALLSYPGTRIRIARDADNRVVGFSSAVPVCIESLPVLEGNVGLKPTAQSYVQNIARGKLARRPDETNTYFFVNLAHTDVETVAAQQALIRDVFGLFALGGTYLVATPIVGYKDLFTALGFQRLRDAKSWFWSSEQPEEGFVLDLTRIGVEPWIEAIVAGRQPPPGLAVDDIERILLVEVLPHWHDETRIAGSALASHLMLEAQSVGERAAQLRKQLEAVLAQRILQVDDERARGLRAIQRAYVRKGASHERVAEDLGVSRSTFYRLLRRGARELATALETHRIEIDTK